MYSAIAEEPTKPIALTRLSTSSVSTASLSPLTTLRMPGGSPASRKSSAMRMGTEASRSDGFSTNALPQAIAGARLAHRIKVDSRTGALGVFALHEMGNAAGELDHLDAALNVAARVGNDLAVLGGQQPCATVEIPLDQLEKLEHHARAPLRVGRGPGRLRGFGIGDRALDLRAVGERDLGLHLSGIGVEDVAEAPRRALDLLAADEMTDLAHGWLSSNLDAARRRPPADRRPRPSRS